MTGAAKLVLVDRHGQVINLAQSIGQGGEGTVYAHAQRDDVVAKLYHRPLSPPRVDKLSAMVQLSNDRLAGISAWPTEMIFDSRTGLVRGFLMPRITDHEPIHVLYSPKDRKRQFPDATWAFLVHAALNTAKAVSVLHGNGIVIGDINHDNVVVSHSATIKLIDCDSFQIRANGQSFLCEVGVDTHTPPELQGRSFREVVRTTNHDAFGLAVVIFQLLFVGRHPFAGTPLDANDISIPSAIKDFRFAYGPQARIRQMRQPPGTLPLEAVSQPVAVLFNRAFAPEGTTEGGRPTANEWAKALIALEKSLRRCPRNAGHDYYSALPACPWCEIESRSGMLLFNVVATGTFKATGPFDLESIWAQIAAIPSPGQPPPVTIQSITLTPSPTVAEWVKQKRTRRLVGLGVALFGLVIGVAVGGTVGFWLFAGVVVVAVIVGQSENADKVAEVRKAYDQARSQLTALDQRWQAEVGPGAFEAMRLDLENKRWQYAGLPALRQQKLHELHVNQRHRQLQRYLDTHRILNAPIDGIGPSRAATLQSFGIETAADITDAKVSAVPGFGPVLTGRLVDWRRSVESKFVFDPQSQVDPRDVKAIDVEIEMMKRRLEGELQNGPVLLQRARQHALRQRDVMLPSLEAARREFAQAEANLRALGQKA